MTIVVASLRKLLENSRVSKHLTNNYAEIATEFQKLVDAKNLADGVPMKSVE